MNYVRIKPNTQEHEYMLSTEQYERRQLERDRRMSAVNIEDIPSLYEIYRDQARARDYDDLLEQIELINSAIRRAARRCQYRTVAKYSLEADTLADEILVRWRYIRAGNG